MRTLLSLVLVAAIAVPVLAAEPKAKKKRGPKKPDPGAMILKKLEKAELTEDQVAKIKELCAGVAEKIVAARQKANLTAEQKKARAEAIKKAKEEGKTGKEMMKAVQGAVELTPEQKSAMDEARKIQGEMMKKVFALLTPEQREKAGLKGPRKKGGEKKPRAKKGGGKKPGPKKDAEKKD